MLIIMKTLEVFSTDSGVVLRIQQMKSIVGGSTNTNSSYATSEKDCPDTAHIFTKDIGDDVCKGEMCVKHC
jgi:hypothetical protein